MTNTEMWYTNVDCMQILGTATKRNRNGYKYKDRGSLMGYKFKKSSLEHMAEVMKLEHQKGQIDYAIFEKEDWTEEETLEIKKYLSSDVLATKQMFDKLWNYWLPFTELLDKKSIEDLSWIRSSIASLTYKSACYFMNTEPTYAEKSSEKEEMGGRVIEPKYEESRNVWYIDFASLYPHIMCMFNLFAEKNPEKQKDLWHGNDLFKVKGYYDISQPHVLAESVKARLKERITLQEKEPDNPLIYTLKIFLNGLYGVARSGIFEKVHTDNCGWDTCFLGQQIQEFVENKMKEFGFETIAGDTDSLFLLATQDKFNNKKYVQDCLNQIIATINKNVPFPVDTFKIKIEHYLEYIMFPFSEQPVIEKEERDKINEGNLEGYEEKIENKKKVLYKKDTNEIVKIGRSWIKKRKGRKKNYLYAYKDDKGMQIELVGLPIMKDNATHLGIKIFNEVLKPFIIKQKSAKFDKEFIEEILNEYLERPKIMKLMAREFKVNPIDSYKLESQIQAQISQHYFDGKGGVIELIKNNKIGKVGIGQKYCTVTEAIDNKLTTQDLDMDKIWSELEPFIQHVETKQVTKKRRKKV